jgi:hypothetical protein
MKKIFMLLSISLALFIISCGEKKDIDTKETPIVEQEQKGESMSNSESANSKLESRRAKGDTIAIDWKKYPNIMPEISGFTKSSPDITSINAMGISYSSFIQDYNNGDNKITITIIDYNTAIEMFSSAAGWKNFQMQTDNDESFSSVQEYKSVEDTWIFEEYLKKAKDANVVLAVNDRFFVSVNANNQNSTKYSKEIAEKLVNDNKNIFFK